MENKTLEIVADPKTKLNRRMATTLLLAGDNLSLCLAIIKIGAIEESMIRHASALIDIILLCQMLIDQLFKELGCLAKLQWSYWSDVATVERSFEQ